MRYTVVNLEDIIIYVKNSVLCQLLGNRQIRQDQFETGGMVFGKITRTNKVVYIESISEAYPEDSHSRYEYIRSLEHATQEINKKVVLGESITYLGEWHTHPCEAFISKKDMKSHKKLNKTTKKIIDGLNYTTFYSQNFTLKKKGEIFKKIIRKLNNGITLCNKCNVKVFDYLKIIFKTIKIICLMLLEKY